MRNPQFFLQNPFSCISTGFEIHDWICSSPFLKIFLRRAFGRASLWLQSFLNYMFGVVRRRLSGHVCGDVHHIPVPFFVFVVIFFFFIFFSFSGIVITEEGPIFDVPRRLHPITCKKKCLKFFKIWKIYQFYKRKIFILINRQYI